MKTTMNISVDEKLKKVFTEYARKIGTNPTNLISMLMTNAVNAQEVTFRSYSSGNFEIERFSEEELKDLLKNDSIRKNRNELQEILSKKKLGKSF